LIAIISGSLELLFGESDMKIDSIHIGVLIYAVAVKSNVRQNLNAIISSKVLLTLHILYLPPLPENQCLIQSLLLLQVH